MATGEDREGGLVPQSRADCSSKGGDDPSSGSTVAPSPGSGLEELLPKESLTQTVVRRLGRVASSGAASRNRITVTIPGESIGDEMRQPGGKRRDRIPSFKSSSFASSSTCEHKSASPAMADMPGMPCYESGPGHFREGKAHCAEAQSDPAKSLVKDEATSFSNSTSFTTFRSGKPKQRRDAEKDATWEQGFAILKDLPTQLTKILESLEGLHQRIEAAAAPRSPDAKSLDVSTVGVNVRSRLERQETPRDDERPLGRKSVHPDALQIPHQPPRRISSDSSKTKVPVIRRWSKETVVGKVAQRRHEEEQAATSVIGGGRPRRPSAEHSAGGSRCCSPSALDSPRASCGQLSGLDSALLAARFGGASEPSSPKSTRANMHFSLFGVSDDVSDAYVSPKPRQRQRRDKLSTQNSQVSCTSKRSKCSRQESPHSCSKEIPFSSKAQDPSSKAQDPFFKTSPRQSKSTASGDGKSKLDEAMEAAVSVLPKPRKTVHLAEDSVAHAEEDAKASPGEGVMGKRPSLAVSIYSAHGSRSCGLRPTVSFSLAEQLPEFHHKQSCDFTGIAIENLETRSRSIIDPSHPLRLFIDVFVVVVTCYLGAVLPARLVYFDADKLHDGFYGVSFLVIDCILLIDVIANFRTTFADDEDEPIRDGAAIALRYARSWLVPDLISVWPLRYSPVGFWLCAACVVKLLRVIHLGPVIARLERECRRLWLLPLRVSIYAFLIVHTLTCSWRYATTVDRPRGVVEATFLDRYVEDLYWLMMTMTTVGYGDIVPQGTGARSFSIIVMLAAPVFSGTVVSLLTHVTRNLFDDELNRKVRRARKFMARRQVPYEMQRRAEHNIRITAKQDSQLKYVPDLLELLSFGLQKEISLELLRGTVLKFPLFKDAPRAFVAELAGAHNWMQCSPGDTVVAEGQIVQEMVWLIQGRWLVQKRWSSREEIDSSDSGSDASDEDKEENSEEGEDEEVCLFSQSSEERLEELEMGPGAWIGEICLFEKTHVRDQTAIALMECELAVLSCSEYDRIMTNFPRLQSRHRIIEQAMGRGDLQVSELAYQGGVVRVQSCRVMAPPTFS